jgi:hypothetical protein
MNTFTQNRIKNTQLDSFNDTCILNIMSGSYDSYGQVIKSYSISGSIPCGYKSNMGSKTYGESEIRMKYSAIFRIDENLSFTIDDRITIIKISGSAINPIQYQIASIDPGHGIKILGCNNTEV